MTKKTKHQSETTFHLAVTIATVIICEGGKAPARCVPVAGIGVYDSATEYSILIGQKGSIHFL